MNRGRIHPQLEALEVPLDFLRLDPLNPKIHPERSIDALAESLERFGQRKPIVARKGSNVVLAGNGLLIAARRLGWDSLAVLFVECNDREAAEYAIADNSTGLLSYWDDETLSTLIASLDGQVIGFTSDEVAELLKEPSPPPADPKPKEEKPEKPPKEDRPERSEEPSTPTIKPYTLFLPVENYDEFLANAEALRAKLDAPDIETALLIGLHKLTS